MRGFFFVEYLDCIDIVYCVMFSEKLILCFVVLEEYKEEEFLCFLFYFEELN